MISRGERISNLDLNSVQSIDKLIKSEGYNATHPVVDIEKIAKQVFDFNCTNCDILQEMKVKSLSVKPKKLILLNPLLNTPDRKIEIAKQLAQNFYSPKNTNIDLIAGIFLLPPFLYKKISNNKLSPKQVLNCLGYQYNDFWFHTVNYLKKQSSFISKTQININNFITRIFKNISK